MNFLEKLLKTNSKDVFGIDASVTGIRQLTARVAAETGKLADGKWLSIYLTVE
jgi:hypothetical protein